MKFIARINWLDPKHGGKINIPFGVEYSPIVKFDSLSGNWSLIVVNKEKISDRITLSEVCYLNENCPHKLYQGLNFELYEGKKIVATGIIEHLV